MLKGALLLNAQRQGRMMDSKKEKERETEREREREREIYTVTRGLTPVSFSLSSER